MRISILLLLAAIASRADEPAPAPNKTVTVFYESANGFAPAAFGEMQRELNRLTAPFGMRFEWLRLEQAPEGGVVSDLVLFRFRGACSMGTLPPLPDELGPFAWTSVTDKVVLPFSEVDCDKLRRTVYVLLWGGERARADFYLGRALGRVVAHEIYHIYSRSMEHGRSGIARRAFSAAELLSEGSVLHPEDLHGLLSGSGRPAPIKNPNGPDSKR